MNNRNLHIFHYDFALQNFSKESFVVIYSLLAYSNTQLFTSIVAVLMLLRRKKVF